MKFVHYHISQESKWNIASTFKHLQGHHLKSLAHLYRACFTIPQRLLVVWRSGFQDVSSEVIWEKGCKNSGHHVARSGTPPLGQVLARPTPYSSASKDCPGNARYRLSISCCILSRCHWASTTSATALGVHSPSAESGSGKSFQTSHSKIRSVWRKS
jgi:hypothetical protein